MTNTDRNIIKSKKNVDAKDVLNINAMPAKTWYWLGVNSSELSWNNSDETSLGENIITAEAGRKYPDVIFSFKDVATLYNNKKFIINAADDSEVCVIVNLNTINNIKVYYDIKVGKNAKVKLIELCKVDENTIYSDINTSCEESGEFELIHMFAGKGNTPDKSKMGEIYSSVKVDLVGDKSDFTYNMGYLAQGYDNFDYNIVVNHIGKMTNCDIKVNGALKENAHKVFRGTIDFKTGSSDSVGAETETVLMLGEEVVNKTVPVILCSEENVSGTHGASIGELDEETLFYFESRGIDKEKAENIMARASVERLTGLIENEKVNDIIENTLQDVLGEE
ncbi:MAG: SufD family Fe-S cluster assembly protein [Lachnospiraceae bacterium]|nr:SufD family Fe-S cluster assembly protein [Lachnospiraceae bacterium]